MKAIESVAVNYPRIIKSKLRFTQKLLRPTRTRARVIIDIFSNHHDKNYLTYSITPLSIKRSINRHDSYTQSTTDSFVTTQSRTYHSEIISLPAQRLQEPRKKRKISLFHNIELSSDKNKCRRIYQRRSMRKSLIKQSRKICLNLDMTRRYWLRIRDRAESQIFQSAHATVNKFIDARGRPGSFSFYLARARDSVSGLAAFCDPLSRRAARAKSFLF